MNKIIFTILFLTLIAHLPAKSQEVNVDSLELAEAFLESENFKNAITFYKRFLELDTENPEINFKLGFALLNTPDGKRESIKYLAKAKKIYGKKRRNRKKVNYIESAFYLARAYRAVYEFDTAIELFTELKSKMKSRRVIKEIDLELQLCQNGKEIYNKNIDIEIINLGDSVNSAYSDHSPVISADESVLIFTSTRPNDSGGEEAIDGSYDENIFISENEAGKWSKPRNISEKINSPEHEATIGLSVDGQTLLIYKGEDEGSIYMSHLEGKEWSKPEKLGKNINTKYSETHASLSADGKYLFFTSDRKGGYGGLDIYVSEIQKDGTWGKAKNLGDAVNTELDEDGPFIHPDQTLYFSSEGHKNLGGFDIFKSKKTKFNTWTKAENLGYPINTVDDDIYYVPTPDGRRAYYSSNKKGGFGGNDIYMIKLNNGAGSNIVVLIGRVFTLCTEELPDTKIIVTDKVTGEKWIYTPNTYSGKFVFVVSKGRKYNLEIEADGVVVFKDFLDIKATSVYQKDYQFIRIDSDVNCMPLITMMLDTTSVNKENVDTEGHVYDDNVCIENISFAYKASDFKSNESLEKLVKYLLGNPDAKIEIGAYADSRGRAGYNRQLSLKRANSIKFYLLKEGIKPEQLVTVGYGEENPITYNKINGVYNKQSLKYNRRAEFKVMVQGRKTLLIKPASNIPEKFKNPNYKINYKLSDKVVECGI